VAEETLPEEAPALLEMRVKQVVLDPRNQTPIVILESEDHRHALPIWIGPYEATSIIMALEEIELPRPMTHDLVIDIVDSLETTFEYVLIHEVKNGAFFAEINLRIGERRVAVEARPSDSIALALRADIPILAERAVCDDMSRIDEFLKEARAEQYKAFLESLDLKEISKYRM